jgi:hypothetical protein
MPDAFADCWDIELLFIDVACMSKAAFLLRSSFRVQNLTVTWHIILKCGSLASLVGQTTTLAMDSDSMLLGFVLVVLFLCVVLSSEQSEWTARHALPATSYIWYRRWTKSWTRHLKRSTARWPHSSLQSFPVQAVQQLQLLVELLQPLLSLLAASVGDCGICAADSCAICLRRVCHPPLLTIERLGPVTRSSLSPLVLIGIPRGIGHRSCRSGSSCGTRAYALPGNCTSRVWLRLTASRSSCLTPAGCLLHLQSD